LISCGSDGEQGPPTPPAYVGGPPPPPSSWVVESVPSGASAEDGGGDCPAPVLPSYGALPVNEKLPDPFTTADGTKLSEKSEWTCRRSEVGAALVKYELGEKPLRPVNVSGKLDQGTLVVTAGDHERSISFPVTLSLPSGSKAPYPVMIGVGGSSLDPELLDELGIATIRFDNDAIAAQVGAQSRGIGKFYDLYGKAHSAGAMMAWAWGVSRVIDALETTAGTDLDVDHIGVTGCSRNGKGALVVGAFDERIRLTIPQESGSGGSAAWRVSDAQLAAGEEVQTLSEITGENCWFRADFNAFNDTATRLPFDHHLLLGRVAPRPLLVLENTDQVWLGDESCYTSGATAHRIWEALEVPERMAVSQLGGSQHCAFLPEQRPILEAYVRKFLLDEDETDVDTNTVTTDGDFTLDEERWIDWETPALD